MHHNGSSGLLASSSIYAFLVCARKLSLQSVNIIPSWPVLHIDITISLTCAVWTRIKKAQKSFATVKFSKKSPFTLFHSTDTELRIVCTISTVIWVVSGILSSPLDLVTSWILHSTWAIKHYAHSHYDSTVGLTTYQYFNLVYIRLLPYDTVNNYGVQLACIKEDVGLTAVAGSMLFSDPIRWHKHTWSWHLKGKNAIIVLCGLK